MFTDLLIDHTLGTRHIDLVVSCVGYGLTFGAGHVAASARLARSGNLDHHKTCGNQQSLRPSCLVHCQIHTGAASSGVREGLQTGHTGQHMKLALLH